MAKREFLKKHKYFFRYKGSDIIYYRRTYKGRDIEFSTGETGIMKALHKAEERLTDVRSSKRRLLKDDKPNAAFSRLWIMYVEDKRLKGIQESTIRSNVTQWNSVLEPFFGKKYVKGLDQKLIKDFEKWYLKNYPKRMYFNVRKTLSSLIKFIKTQGYKFEDIELGDLDTVIKANKKHEKAGRVFTKKEIEKLKSAADKRTRLGIMIAHERGLRKTEFLSLEIKNIEGRRLKVWSFKNKKWRTVFISENLAKEIKSYIKYTSPKKYLFEAKNRKGEHIPMHGQSFDRGWTAAKIKAGIKGATEPLRARVHDLRHTCATNMAESGMPTSIACAILDMTLPIFEKTYVHITEEKIKEWSQRFDNV